MATEKREGFLEREIRRVEAELAVPEAQVRAQFHADAVEALHKRFPDQDPEKLAEKYPIALKGYVDDLYQYYLTSRKRHLGTVREYQERFKKAGFEV